MSSKIVIMSEVVIVEPMIAETAAAPEAANHCVTVHCTGETARVDGATGKATAKAAYMGTAHSAAAKAACVATAHSATAKAAASVATATASAASAASRQRHRWRCQGQRCNRQQRDNCLAHHHHSPSVSSQPRRFLTWRSRRKIATGPGITVAQLCESGGRLNLNSEKERQWSQDAMPVL
jgi:hypothetical protein